MALTIGEYYRLRSTPNYSWVKVLCILKPNTPQNKNRFVLVKCEHTVDKNDTFGFVRLFRLHEILPNNRVHADAGDSAVSTSSLQASADTTSQTVT